MLSLLQSQNQKVSHLRKINKITESKQLIIQYHNLMLGNWKYQYFNKPIPNQSWPAEKRTRFHKLINFKSHFCSPLSNILLTATKHSFPASAQALLLNTRFRKPCVIPGTISRDTSPPASFTLRQNAMESSNNGSYSADCRRRTDKSKEK